MYLRVDDLGQPNLPGNPVPMPPQPPPPGPGPVPIPNPGIPTPPPVPSLSIAVVGSKTQCTAAQLARIQGVIPGATVTNDFVGLAIARAHNGIWLDLTDDAGPARAELLKPTLTLDTVSKFTNAFGQSPTKLPWRGARRNLGWIVATRLGGARRTMFSSSVRISCWGYPWPGGGVDLPMDYMVKALPKRERVGLGALFWRAAAKPDQVQMAAAILAAGLVIRYGVSYRVIAPPLGNLHCYLKYALSMLGHPIPPWVTDKCPQVV